MIYFIAGFVLSLALFWVLQRKEATRTSKERVDDVYAAEAVEAQWNAALASVSGSPVLQTTIRIARPFRAMPGVDDIARSGFANTMQRRLAAAGGLYGNSVEVFLATQFAAICFGIIITLASITLLDGFQKLWLGAIAFVVAIYPWQALSQKATQRAEQVTQELPDFAELLQMPLVAGEGIIPALRETAAESTGAVAEEVRIMLRLIDSRALSEEEAFIQTGDRLGTPAARAFFSALAQSYTEGTKILENMSNLAKSLRIEAFQQQRQRIKKLPTRILVGTMLHSFPLLFVVVIVPVFQSLSEV